MKPLFFVLLVCVFASCFPVVHAPAVSASGASCMGPDGQSRCGHVTKWNKSLANLGASNGGDRAASIQPSWTVPAWAIDTTNSSTCASDNNNCTQTTCGAAGSFQGPCVTWGEVAARWGTFAPRLQQATIVTVMSAMASTDMVYPSPLIEGSSSYLSFNCTLGSGQQAWTGTLGTVTPKNRATAQLLAAVLPASTPAANQLVINTTHPSRAWINALVTGTTWNFSEPVLTTITGNAATYAEVDTWTAGDTVTAYNPSSIYLGQSLPWSTNASATFVGKAGVRILGCNVATPDQTIVNQFVQAIDTTYQGYWLETPMTASVTASSPGVLPDANLINVSGTNGDLRGEAGVGIFGGIVDQTSTAQGGIYLDGDVIVYALKLYGPWASLGNVFINGLLDSFTLTGVNGALWGTGQLSVNGNSLLVYPTGAGGAAATFLMTGAFRLNASTTACSHTNATPDAIDCGISLTPAHLDAAQGVAGFGGNAFQVGGGQITNISQF